MTVILKCFVKQILRIHFKMSKGQSFAVALELFDGVSLNCSGLEKKENYSDRSKEH